MLQLEDCHSQVVRLAQVSLAAVGDEAYLIDSLRRLCQLYAVVASQVRTQTRYEGDLELPEEFRMFEERAVRKLEARRVACVFFSEEQRLILAADLAEEEGTCLSKTAVSSEAVRLWSCGEISQKMTLLGWLEEAKSEMVS